MTLFRAEKPTCGGTARSAPTCSEPLLAIGRRRDKGSDRRASLPPLAAVPWGVVALAAAVLVLGIVLWAPRAGLHESGSILAAATRRRRRQEALAKTELAPVWRSYLDRREQRGNETHIHL